MNDEDLNRMLQSWKVEPALPSSFQREVWHRIESTAAAERSAAPWLEAILTWLARPVPATVACALALSGGLLAGGVVGRDTAPSSSVVAYADSINPLTKASHQ